MTRELLTRWDVQEIVDQRLGRLTAVIAQLQGAFGNVRELRFGAAAGAWPGGSPRASNTLVAHGLQSGVVPVVMAGLLGSPSATWFPMPAAFGPDETYLQITAVTSDGSSPAAGTGYGVVWAAVVLA